MALIGENHAWEHTGGSTFGAPMRERLDDERDSIAIKVNVFGYKGRVIFGYNKDHILKEMQCFVGIKGTIVNEYFQVISILVSKALQYNCSVESIAKRFEGIVSEPSGFADGVKYESFSSYVAFLLRKYSNGKERKIKGPETKEEHKQA